jgi:hypothetical protein
MGTEDSGSPLCQKFLSDYCSFPKFKKAYNEDTKDIGR